MGVRPKVGGRQPMKPRDAATRLTQVLRALRDQQTTSGDEAGQAYVELVMVLPLFLIVIAALIFFGRVLYVKIALDMTTYDACRAAVEALQPGDGIAQGLTAGQQTLSGFHLNPAGAGIAVSPTGGWVRGAPVQCTASYDLFVGDIPGAASMGSESGVSIQSTTWSRVELWRSDWR
jgi:Flp pilus assembly protein TadG